MQSEIIQLSMPGNSTFRNQGKQCPDNGVTCFLIVHKRFDIRIRFCSALAASVVICDQSAGLINTLLKICNTDIVPGQLFNVPLHKISLITVNTGEDLFQVCLFMFYPVQLLRIFLCRCCRLFDPGHDQSSFPDLLLLLCC